MDLSYRRPFFPDLVLTDAVLAIRVLLGSAGFEESKAPEEIVGLEFEVLTVLL